MNMWTKNFSFFDTQDNNVKKREKPLDEDVASQFNTSVKRRKKASSQSSVRSRGSKSSSSQTSMKNKSVKAAVAKQDLRLTQNCRMENASLDEESTQVRKVVCIF